VCVHDRCPVNAGERDIVCRVFSFIDNQEVKFIDNQEVTDGRQAGLLS
jgi:hypothetical protein